METRIGVIAILLEDRQTSAPAVNRLLGEFCHVILGRIGLPYRDRTLHIIAILVEGTTDELGALTGKLGMLQGVKTKSLLLTR